MSDEKKPEIGVIICGGPPPPDAETLPETCPKCGTETQFGFGLAGGGYGPYVACMNDACDFFAKRQSDE